MAIDFATLSDTVVRVQLGRVCRRGLKNKAFREIQRFASNGLIFAFTKLIYF